jgi:hypothetical protein
MSSPLDPKRDLLRHTLATLAYRGGKALRGAPPGFEEFTAGPARQIPAASGDPAVASPAGASRTAGKILAHVGDLLDWGLALAEGRKEWNDSPALPWNQGVERFFALPWPAPPSTCSRDR